MLHEQELLVRRIVSDYEGREVKSTGDGFLLDFGSVLKATECAIEIQTKLHDRNLKSDSQPIRLRIGIHTGEVEVRDSDIFGDAVNVAARVLTVSEPEGIAISEDAVSLLQDKLEFPLESVGTRELKGIDRRFRVFRVVLPWSGPLSYSEAKSYPRLAVLPLRNISPEPGDAYFADGMTEELISSLGQVRELRVISRSSVDHFKSEDRMLGDIGRELGATAVLEGSVRKAGGRLRISLQLIEVATQERLWSQTFDRSMDDVFAVQAEVGERTAASLRVHLLGREKAVLTRTLTSNLAAYGLYLQGLHLSKSFEDVDHRKAIGLFRQAIDQDSSFSEAHSQLANLLLGSIGESNPAGAVVPEARGLIEKAISLNPLSPEAHTAKGNLAMQGDLNWAIAEAEFKRAVDLSPSDPDPRTWYLLLLRALQRYSDAAEQAKTVIELDPLSAGAYSLLVSIMRLTGNLVEAERIIRTSYRPMISPMDYHTTLAYTYYYGGRREEALRELELATAASPMAERNQDIPVLHARLGNAERARAMLEADEKRAAEGYVPFLHLAALSGAVEDSDRAMGYLERDWSEGDRGLWFIYQGVCFDPIRTDQRFIRMLERYQLPTSAPFHRGGRVQAASSDLSLR